MKTFKFEIIITEQDVEGDEFWEEAIEKDGTGIKALTEAIIFAIESTNLMINSERTPSEVVTLKSYIDGTD